MSASATRTGASNSDCPHLKGQEGRRVGREGSTFYCACLLQICFALNWLVGELLANTDCQTGLRTADYGVPRLAADCPKVSKLKFIECIVRVLALLLRVSGHEFVIYTLAKPQKQNRYLLTYKLCM